MNESGTVCCKSVPPEAITRHRILPWDYEVWSEFGGDASPSPKNYRFAREEHLFGIEYLLDHGFESTKTMVKQRQAEFLNGLTPNIRAVLEKQASGGE